MTDADFRRQLEEDAARTPATHAESAGVLAQVFDGLSAARIPFVRAHMAYAALDAYLMMAVDIYGRKGTVFTLNRLPATLALSRGSQVVTCTHYLNLGVIGFNYAGIQSNPALVPMTMNGFPSMAESWKPCGQGLLTSVDRDEMQAKVSEIAKFLLLVG